MYKPARKQLYANHINQKLLENESQKLLGQQLSQKTLLPLPWKLWPSEAKILLGLIFCWCLGGLFILTSASWWIAYQDMGNGAYFLQKQLLWMAASWSIGFCIISINLKTLIKLSRPLLLFFTFLVASTLFIGSNINGSSRWLFIGPIQIQPSELVKPFVILQAAYIFGTWSILKNTQKAIWLLTFAILIFSIIEQPNLSTAALIGILIWIIALASGISLKKLIFTAFCGLSIGISSILINEYQYLRVTSFLNPWKDPQDTGYQLIQSLLAIGSGGLLGQGYGLSIQKLDYLPFLSTDFIFSVFAEEFGFMGSLLVILFLSLIAFLGLVVSLRCQNNYSKLIAIGCSSLLVGQSIMHLSVTTGLMPTTGLPLPFVSYGGNSLLSCVVIASLLLRCSLESTGLIGGLKIKKKLA